MASGLQRNIEQGLGVPEPGPETVEVKLYVHRDKESNWSMLGEDPILKDAELSDEAKQTFAYTGYEIELDCVVDVKTGKAMIHKVAGVALEEPVSA